MAQSRRDASRPLELWGGIECTVNRVGDRYFDQSEWSGHDRRPDDLDRIAALGVRTLRYPVLWEKTAPDGRTCDWSGPDERLGRLRRLGVRPILGLVHHGSGPRHTALTEPSFAAGLADFARRVAERYPWVDAYTPVNEPLTTARFSGLYGVWYPHGRDARTFLRCLLNQCRAVALAMRAVRAVRPGAQLVQTDDLGKTYAVPALAYQADFENERRWLTYDLLCGRVGRRHPLRGYFKYFGVPDADVDWFLDNSCPPDVIGVNHYLTSERFLDDRPERYPAACRGGNGRHVYADVEAVRVLPEGVAGPRALLGEAWERYRLPLAVTEAHLGCTREEQMRWLLEVWRGARAARRDGADVRAVTAWSVLGAHEWDTLVARPHGHYEPGVFDLRGPAPRLTALAALARDLAAGRVPAHPVLAGPGWWRRPRRLTHAPEAAAPPAPAPGRPLLITGATGAAGRAFARLCEARGLAFRLLNRRELDAANPASAAAALEEFDPWAVIHAAGCVRPDVAGLDPGARRREYARGPAVLAAACARRGVALLTFSTDLVFDGRSRVPYVESDLQRPLNLFGRAAAAGERRAAERHPAALVVRVGPLFGPWDEPHFVAAADDAVVSPTYLPDLVHACLDLLIDGERGVWHLANPGAVTWADFAREVARRAGFDEAAVRGRPARAARTPAYSALGSERGVLLPPLDDALTRYFLERRHVGVEPPAPHRDGRAATPAGAGAGEFG